MIAINSYLAVLPLLTLTSGAARLHGAPAGQKVVIGYIQDEADASSVADDIEYSKITHLNIAFANPTDATGSLAPTPHMLQIVSKAHKARVKVLISIGGGSASEDKTERERYFDLIGDPKRGAFVRTLVTYLDNNRLDGLDVDLEGPAIGKDYAAFITDLSKALKPKGKLLSAAVAKWNGDQIPSAALNCFDFVNVMAYDATGPWNPNQPGQHASMEFAKDSAAYWVGRGVAKSKVVLGVPFYGWGFGAAFTQGGYQYSEIVGKYPGSELVDQVGSTIWYNGIPTIKTKAKYVVDQGLGGVMIWSLNQDAKGKLSLLTAINEALNGSANR